MFSFLPYRLSNNSTRFLKTALRKHKTLLLSYFMSNAISPSLLLGKTFWLIHIVIALSILSSTHIATTPPMQCFIM